MIASNAPFNDFGHSMILRQLEDVDMRLDALSTTGGDLSPGAGSAVSQTDLTAAANVFLQKANNLSDLTSVSTALSNLGIKSSATHVATDFLLVANNLSDLNNVGTARTNLGLGSAALQNTSAFLQPGNNLSDVSVAATARTNLGLGTIATQDFTSVVISGGAINVPTFAVRNAGATSNLSFGVTGTVANISAGGSLTKLQLGLDTVVGGSLGNIAFFGATPAAKTSVSNPASNSNADLLTFCQNIRAALASYNLI